MRRKVNRGEGEPVGRAALDRVKKRFSGFYGFKRFKGGGAAHKNIEAPRSINNGKTRRWYLVTSHQSLVTSHSPIFLLRQFISNAIIY